jgi:carbon monoxide dehydrogenase subunit G
LLQRSNAGLDRGVYTWVRSRTSRLQDTPPMEMRSERRLPLPREAVWAALNDPEVLRACVPGCESMERVAPGHYETVVYARFGPLRAQVRAQILVIDPNPPESYTLQFQGIGRTASLASGEAGVVLTATEWGGCVLSYDASAQVTGRLARLSRRLVQGTARRMADDFFDNFVAYLGRSPRAGGCGQAGANEGL